MKNAFMIAATGSGCGKTTITCALLEALKRRGEKVRSFKCGPDYIDPMFHREILGIPSKNLDLFFAGEALTRELFLLDNDSDVSVVEGVMGLYDGMHVGSAEGSSYHLACALNLPILLVVDAHGMGRSILAVLKGFLEMDVQKRIKGVILNRISPMFFAAIKPLIEEELSLCVVGYYPKREEGAFESRYLGLKLPGEIGDLKAKVESAADVIEQSADMDRLLELSTVADCVDRLMSQDEETNRVRIGIAMDAAFCFYYEDNLRMLKEAGACLVPFSPLLDEKLPEGICGLILGGGYPENYAKELSENRKMLSEIKTALDAGMPSLAECGGFMYLHEGIQTRDGDCYEWVGSIPGKCSYTGHLVRFGYLTMEEKQGRFLPWDHNRIRAHEFHYYDSDNNGNDCISTKPVTGKSWESANVGEDHFWGYAHLYYPSNPAFPKCFVEKCLNYFKTVDKKKAQ